MGVAHAWAGGCSILLLHLKHQVVIFLGNWTLAEKCLTDATTVLVTRIVSHPIEKEELDGIVNDIKARIGEHKEMEKGVFNDSYVKAPGGTNCWMRLFQMFCFLGGKIMSDLGVAGAVESGKPVAIGTVGTA